MKIFYKIGDSSEFCARSTRTLLKVPDSASEGSVQVVGFDGEGVPVIKAEAAKIQSRLGNGEKCQKKKEAIVGVSYTIDKKVRTAEEVAENLIYPEQAKAKEITRQKTALNRLRYGPKIFVV